MGRVPPRVFRPYLALRVAVVLALAAWLGVALLAMRLPDMPAAALWEASAFCLLFSWAVAHFLPWRIVVDQDTVSSGGLFQPRAMRLGEIERIDVDPVPLFTAYGVHGARGDLAFTSFISGHRELALLLRQRARVRPLNRA